MEIQDLKIKNYGFTALISASELSQRDQDYLALNNDDELVEIQGEFTVEWEEDTPLVVVQYAIANNNNREIDLEDYVLQFFEDKIYEKGSHSDWLTDRDDSLSDYYEEDV